MKVPINSYFFTSYRGKPNKLTPEQEAFVRERVEEAKRRAYEKLRRERDAR